MTASAQAATRPHTAQHQLSDYLHGELLHTLGAYQLAEDKLSELHSGFGSREPAEKTLSSVVERARDHNGALREKLHKPQSGGDPEQRCRHPSPFEGQSEKLPKAELLIPVRAYYETAAEALRRYLSALEDGRPVLSDGEQLGRRLAYIHDPQRRGSGQDEKGLVEDRLRRTHHRLEKLLELPGIDQDATPSGGIASRFEAIRGCHMERDWEVAWLAGAERQPFHLTVVQALSDAHDWMHESEHLRSRTFGQMFSRIRETHTETEAMLKRSIVLNTFVYVTARSVPWVFAQNEEERRQVFEGYDDCHKNHTPTYCMWIGNQLAMLAMERRAYTWWTLGRHDRAYRDFYKLTRLLKSLRGQIDERGMRVPGTKTMVVGLTATAEHHIGRIYHGQHAHPVALRYFDRASAHLEGWEEHEEIGHILRNSRWRLELLISRGKANYELGRMKSCLLSYAEAWRAFLQLAESESRTTANFKVVNEVIAWLKSIEDEPALSKVELRKRLEPLVRQFESVYSPLHLRLLAAEIMMRLGHLLHVLKLPPLDWTPEVGAGPRHPVPDYELAERCMLQAAALDRTSTLIATDLLKIRHGVRLAKKAARESSGPEDDRPSGEEQGPSYPEMARMAEQWPGGGGRFEEAARAIEYVVQNWLDGPGEARKDGEDALPGQVEIARELLRSFLAHTDSSNVKLAQVYRYLMQPPREADRDATESAPTIEIVCLRRYSSFFPFLPRPAAFRALGGGYLVQVREAGESERPFGIAIDPGPHFLNNLYRCGYGLADIHMIVVTHDHADHIASLDALLALMGSRSLFGADTFGEGNRLLILGNDSVVERYGFYNEDEPVRLVKDLAGNTKPAKRLDTVRVMSFSRFDRLTRRTDPDLRSKGLERAGIQLTPPSLRIQPVKTVDHVDAAGHVSQGFLLSMGRTPETRSSVLFTSDTGPQPKPSPPAPNDKKATDHYFAKGTKSLKAAVAEADIVVAHLSSVPLPELRRLAALAADRVDDEPTRKFIELWERTTKQARAWKRDPGAAEARFLLRQLQFAFRSRGEGETFAITPLSPPWNMKPPSEKHLFLSGLLDLANHMVTASRRSDRKPLLLIGELREELGTFRTRIASRITETVFDKGEAGTALTTDIGLRLRISRPDGAEAAEVSVLCTTCDLDNDLVTSERFHSPKQIQEVSVKGENEGVFYNCALHDPGRQPELLWVESVERYNVFGD